MGYSKELDMKRFSIAIPENLNDELCYYLIRDDKEEDLIFALWNESIGSNRDTALIYELIYPEEGDRQRHGNVSFNPQYIKRVCLKAAEKNCGIAFIHSHPFPGWQNMSNDDIIAEKVKLSDTVEVLTGYPLVGMTIGSDGTWSGRRWIYNENTNEYNIQWAENVRSAGRNLKIDYTDFLVSSPKFSKQFKRTRAVWGKDNHEKLAKMRIGIVGLGSVGSMVAEGLARMGLEKFVLIDFDKVEEHNLDRLVGSTKKDIGKYKVDVTNRQISSIGTSANIDINKSNKSLYEEEAFRLALDCDILFSCVDRPRARYILNHIAYAHLIPVIDGGIQVRFDGDETNGYDFSGADWQLQTISPNKPCLQCLEVYTTSDVSLEIDGMLDDPSYIKGLPKDDYKKKNNENIFPFSSNLASLEIFQLIAFTTKAGDVSGFGVQRFRYNPGIISQYYDKKCKPGCDFVKTIATGDKYIKVFN
ncbi:MAG: ThiF family adenylyltransferase [Lutibacter sp.]